MQNDAQIGIKKNQSIENFNQDVISEEKHRTESQDMDPNGG